MEFPLHPTAGEQFIGTKNRVFEWDGDKWKKGKPLPPEVATPVIVPVVSDFWPSDPIVGEQVADSLGRRWQWDGEKWIGVAWVPAAPGPEFEWPPLGVTDGSDADAGYIGETLVFTNTVTGTANVNYNIPVSYTVLTVTLPAGDWDTSACFDVDIVLNVILTFSGGANGHGAFVLSTDYPASDWSRANQITACPGHSTTQVSGITSFGGAKATLVAPKARLSLTQPATIVFSVSVNIFGLAIQTTRTITGQLWARRVR